MLTPVAKLSLKRKSHQREREHEARDKWRDDRRENRVTVHTPSRRPTTHVGRENRRNAREKCNSFDNFPYVVALVCFGNDQIVSYQRDIVSVCYATSCRCVTRHRVGVLRDIVSVCFT